MPFFSATRAPFPVALAARVTMSSISCTHADKILPHHLANRFTGMCNTYFRRDEFAVLVGAHRNLPITSTPFLDTRKQHSYTT